METFNRMDLHLSQTLDAPRKVIK